MKRFLVLLTLLSVIALVIVGAMPRIARATHGVAPTIRLVLWSWQHDDDLRLLRDTKIGVAYYAGTIILGRDVATFKKRPNRLLLAESTPRFPVFRMENAHHGDISKKAFDEASDIIATYCSTKNADAVQIDFDAELSDRDPYLAFLHELKRKLPAKTSLSVTALSSWCLDDKWLQKAPVDETVAMMFAMGKGKREVFDALKRERLDSGASCAQSVGISISEHGNNERLRKEGCMGTGQRVYAFSPLGWTKQRYEEVLSEVKYHE